MKAPTFTRLRQKLALLFATKEERRHAQVGPAHLWKMKREFQIAYLKRAGLEPGQRFLDLGCGTLRGGLPVIEYLDPGHYTGLEVRAEVLDEARAELAEARLEEKRPNLVHASDLGALELATRFDYVWAFSVLIHMEDEVLERALGFVAQHLAPGGTFLANVRTQAGGGERWERFPAVTRALEFYTAAGARHGLAVCDLGSLAALGHLSGDTAQDSQRMLSWRRAEPGARA